MKTTFLFTCLLCYGLSHAQTALLPASNAGMGGISSLPQDVTALFANPAGMASLQKRSLMAAVERRFLLADLSVAGAGIALPIKNSVLGFALQSFGFQAFRQNQVRLGYARKLGERLSAGLQFYYMQTRIPEYGSKGLVSASVGVQAGISKQVRLGAYLRNPVPQEWAKGERLPTIFSLGIAWHPSEKVAWAMEFEKDMDFDLRVRSGLEYQVSEAILLRAGVATEPATVHFGVGYRLSKGLNLDASSYWHPTLGLSPGLSVSTK